MSRSRLFVSFAFLCVAASACSSSSSTPSDSGSTGSGGSGSGGAGSGGAMGSGGAGSGGSGSGGASVDVAPDVSVDTPPETGGDLPGRTMMTFFISSTGSGAMGGNLGGLAGADAKCQMLAMAVGAGGRTWHAYLSVSAMGGMPAVNARDRIGTGPWHNQKGVMIAADVAALHVPASNTINATNGIDETGATVPTNQHDIVTGSTADGMVSGTANCANWTSNAATGVTAQVGHFNRGGGGQDPMSWNSAHATPNCSQASIMSVAGAARTYCFAIN